MHKKCPRCGNFRLKIRWLGCYNPYIRILIVRSHIFSLFYKSYFNYRQYSTNKGGFYAQ